MSWSPPNCPNCSSLATRFVRAFPGPPGSCMLGWTCTRCRTRMLEPCPVGLEQPRAGACLDCGAPVDADDVCERCGVEQTAILARIHAHCGAPPQLDAIRGVAERGLVRVAFNALDLRLAEQPAELDTRRAKARLLLDVHRPEAALVVLRRALELGAAEDALALELGEALAGSGQPAAALRVLERLLARDPEPEGRALAWVLAGECLVALGRAAEAVAYVRRALAGDPACLVARRGLVASPTDADQQEPVAIDLEHDRRALLVYSLERQATGVDRLVMQAGVLMDRGEFDAARTCIGMISKLEPDGGRDQAMLELLARSQACVPKN